MTKEKAKEASPFLADQEWYIKGATDQQKIDIELFEKVLNIQVLFKGLSEEGKDVILDNLRQLLKLEEEGKEIMIDSLMI